jgi:lipopolysaccharide assembly outer membrane protein LptD (OstA)
LSLQILSHLFTKIVFIALRTNLFHIVFLAFLLTFGYVNSYSQEFPKKSILIPAKNQPDSLKIGLKNISKINDTIKKDSIIKKKTLLGGKIKYKAANYAKISQKKKQITLYDKAEVYYKDIELKAGTIVIDYEKSEVYAGRKKDSANSYSQYPYFKQGDNIVEPDSIRFNFKTKKALIWNSRTDQSDFRVKGEITKRENDSVYFIKNARFTTSKNIDDPEYYFHARKIKLVPGKKVVTGFTNMVIQNVPTPIAIPFAYFPLSKETSVSGLIIPTPGDSNAQGYFLQNGGYYFALSKHYDLALLGDYYTNGSFAIRAETSYAQIYKFRGNFNFRFQNQLTGERGLPGYSKSNEYNIQWTHAPDAKATPNSRFSASVNLGSQKYFKNSLNQVNTAAALNNTLSSSVSYSKTFNTVPQINMALTASHSQNTNTGIINMTLPTLTASVDRIFPFAKKDAAKKGLIKNINITYNLSARNEIQTVDSLFFKPQMFKDANINAATNYREIWYLKTINKTYNPVTNLVDETNKGGFDAFRTYDFSAGLGTTIYGTFKVSKDKKIQAIRHVMTPNVSYSYKPSFEKYYDTYAIDGSGKMQDYTRFEKGIFGGPDKNFSNNLSFSINNTFEAKVKDRDSTKVEPKKVMLLNNLQMSTGYNLSALEGTQAWQPLRISGGTNLFKDKMNINFGATLNPYAIDANGKNLNTFNIDNNGSLFRLTSANMTLNYSFSSKDTKDKKTSSLNNNSLRNGGREDDLFGKTNDFSNRRESQFSDDDKEDKFSGFFHALIPWDLKLAYSLTYTNDNREKKISNSSLMFSGNIDITPKWKAGVSSGYDFVGKGVTPTQLRFERNLESWRMDFNWTPFGNQASWFFFIGISSSVLSDIKWDKNSTPDRRL